MQLHLAPRGLQRHLAAVTRRAGHRDLGPGLLASRGRGLQGGQGGRGGPAQHRSGRGPGRHAPGRGSRHPHLDTRTRLHHHPPRGSTHLVTRARVRQVRHQRRGPARRGEQRARVQRVAAAEGRRRGEQQREAGGRQLDRGHGGGEAGHWGTGMSQQQQLVHEATCAECLRGCGGGLQTPGQLGGVGDLVAGGGAEAAQASGAARHGEAAAAVGAAPGEAPAGQHEAGVHTAVCSHQPQLQPGGRGLHGLQLRAELASWARPRPALHQLEAAAGAAPGAGEEHVVRGAGQREAGLARGRGAAQQPSLARAGAGPGLAPADRHADLCRLAPHHSAARLRGEDDGLRDAGHRDPRSLGREGEGAVTGGAINLRWARERPPPGLGAHLVARRDAQPQLVPAQPREVGVVVPAPHLPAPRPRHHEGEAVPVRAVRRERRPVQADVPRSVGGRDDLK